MSFAVAGGAARGQRMFSWKQTDVINHRGEDAIRIAEGLYVLFDGHGNISRFEKEELLKKVQEYFGSPHFQELLKTGQSDLIQLLLNEWSKELHSSDPLVSTWDCRGTTLSIVIYCEVEGVPSYLLVAWGDSPIVVKTTNNEYFSVGHGNGDTFDFARCSKALSANTMEREVVVPFLRKGGKVFNEDGRILYHFKEWSDLLRYAQGMVVLGYDGLKVEDLIKAGYIQSEEELKSLFESGKTFPNPFGRLQLAMRISFLADKRGYENGFQSCGSGLLGPSKYNGMSPWSSASIAQPELASPNIGAGFAGCSVGNGIGDKYLIPFVGDAKFTPECKFLPKSDVSQFIIGSDGFWDILTHEEAFEPTTSEKLWEALISKASSSPIFRDCVREDIFDGYVISHDDVSFISVRL